MKIAHAKELIRKYEFWNISIGFCRFAYFLAFLQENKNINKQTNTIFLWKFFDWGQTSISIEHNYVFKKKQISFCWKMAIQMTKGCLYMTSQF